jgi:hypothetical protein
LLRGIDQEGRLLESKKGTGLFALDGRPFLPMGSSFDRTNKTLRVAPTMEAGISEHLWSLEEIVDLSD